jgi:lipopolysaccharide assembly outer membrane protein LptD (OstA)
MMRMVRQSMKCALWLLFIGAVISTGWVHAQQKAFEVLPPTQILDVRTVGSQQIQALIGTVHMVQPSPTGNVTIWCDSALRNLKTNVVQLYGHVRIIRDSINLTSTEGLYFGDERRAELPKGVRLTRGRMVLTADRGKYWANEKRAEFYGAVHVVDSTSSTLSDSLTYFESEEKSIAVGNVSIFNADNNLTVFGDSVIHFDKRKYSVVPKRPKLMQVDTTSAGAVDTLVVTALFMEAIQDTSSYFIARGRVEMARTDFSARCGDAVYYLKGDRVILHNKPVVWHAENQVTGDSIVIRTNEHKLDRVLVYGHAFAVSRVDSVHRMRYNQLSARDITMHFQNGKIVGIDADRTATSLYYLFDGLEPNGVNRSSGDRILMEFVAGNIDRIKIVGGVEGKYFPERMIMNHEHEYNLDGFRWIPDRPKRKQLGLVNDSNE